MAQSPKEHVNLTRYAWLSLAAAVATIVLKTSAYAVTGSVGLLSDAAESLVNLAAAVIALLVLRTVAKPADSRYTFGRSKAEYFSSAVEGSMIFVAAGFIMYAAVGRLLHPQAIDKLGVGLVISVIASLINGAVSLVLLHAAKLYRSPTLHADGIHLGTDVVTSAGVVIGVTLVGITHWQPLDPIVALLVGINIIVAGFRLVRGSLAGLMDVTLPDAQNKALLAVLRQFTTPTVQFHGLQTRVSGHEAYANVDIQVPGQTSVLASHQLAEDVKTAMKSAVDDLHVMVHVEPIEDQLSYEDIPEGYIPINMENQENL
ncbi:MAG: cation diffusion facilitator family transporter [Actinomycetaceae bacterium]|nr:cation diffusion facilitator family transporter [Actinomycetaceae bacterium]MDY6082967.1 cation diffusion facilitator family transporter [Actinomycetaceae bacterium]